MDDDEFDKALYAEIEKTLSKEYPNAEFSPELIPLQYVAMFMS